jgi:signal transduction histidine kinase
MSMLRSLRRPLLGALIGTVAALFAIYLGTIDQLVLPYTVIVVLAVALSGLALGSVAAAAAFVAGAAGLVVHAILDQHGTELMFSDVVRIIAFLIGCPAIVYLVHRAEVARRDAARVLAASREATSTASAHGAALEAARQELDAALGSAERERARLEEVAEAIPEPLIVYDDALQGTYGNRAALRLFGRSFVERPMDEWARVTEPRDAQGRQLSRDEWPQVVAQSAPYRGRVLLRIPMSGRDMLVDVEGTPIPGGGAVLLLRDVGQEEDARRRLSRFASFVAHELRNPLAVAKARIELALRDTTAPQRTLTHATRALESVDAAIGILERLELYSRADSGSVEAAREPFELGPAIVAAIERLRTEGSTRQVLRSGVEDVRVLGDRQLAEQVITNLLTNANRYSTPGTPIHLEVDVGDVVTLRVRDEGPGIADDVARRLFSERVTAGRGLGLGLYLVNASMEAMGGSVSLERRQPNAVFALRWPSAEGGTEG